MITWIVLAFFWAGNIDGETFAVRDGHRAMFEARCHQLHPEATLRRYRSGMREYKIVWRGGVAPQTTYPGWDYICVLEEDEG